MPQTQQITNASETETETNIFEDNLTQEQQEKIRLKSQELLAFLEKKDANEIREILEELTIDDIKALENSSKLLNHKISDIESIEDSQSNNITKSLIQLSIEISQINPNTYNFDSNRLLSFIPFIGRPINKYLKKFKSASSIIENIIESLNNAEQLLRDDNAVLQYDKQRYRDAAIELQRKALIMQHVVENIEEKINSLDEKEQNFYKNGILLNLQKKIRSIYEILLVTQEGFVANDFVINTNWELIDNISNVRSVTKRALEIGVSTLVALEDQKNVLKAIEQTKQVTNELILNNAKLMNTQGTEIYRQASNSSINLDALKEAFENIDDALNKINELKKEALLKAQEESNQMKEISQKLENKIHEIEQTENLSNKNENLSLII